MSDSEIAASSKKRRSPRDFFISFNQADVATAQRVQAWLEAAGYSTFIQHADIHAGANFVLKMDEGLKTCRRLIALLSPDYLAAEFPQPEWAAFFAKDPRGVAGLVVGVRVKKCQVDGLVRTGHMGNRLTGNMGDTKPGAYALERHVTDGTTNEICEPGRERAL